MKCPKCGKISPEKSRRCIHCGSMLGGENSWQKIKNQKMIKCPHCHSDIPEGSGFCRECFTRISAGAVPPETKVEKEPPNTGVGGNDIPFTGGTPYDPKSSDPTGSPDSGTNDRIPEVSTEDPKRKGWDNDDDTTVQKFKKPSRISINKPMAIIAAAILVVLLVLVVIFKNHSSGEDGSTDYASNNSEESGSQNVDIDDTDDNPNDPDSNGNNDGYSNNNDQNDGNANGYDNGDNPNDLDSNGNNDGYQEDGNSSSFGTPFDYAQVLYLDNYQAIDDAYFSFIAPVDLYDSKVMDQDAHYYCFSTPTLDGGEEYISFQATHYYDLGHSYNTPDEHLDHYINDYHYGENINIILKQHQSETKDGIGRLVFDSSDTNYYTAISFYDDMVYQMVVCERRSSMPEEAKWMDYYINVLYRGCSFTRDVGPVYTYEEYIDQK